LQKDVELSEHFYLIAGDYEEATDHVDQGRAKIAIKTYLASLGLASQYNLLCVDLLLSEREFPASDDNDKLFEEEEGEFNSCRGCLMGEPGTKIVLTILTRCAETYARRETGLQGSAYFFASAGDDQLGVGTSDYYNRLVEGAVLFGLKPSKEKFGLFKKGVNYCEQIVRPGKTSYRRPEDYSDSALVDVLKVRLFSPESKHGGVDANDHMLESDFNPVWGKARDIEKQMRYNPLDASQRA
jgi:hypothetical protein